MLTLYYAPHTCALASHIALEEAGAAYESVRLSFRTEDQKKPDYLKINPKARVPSLVTDRGVITETPALLIYIAQAFPAAKLAPLDPIVYLPKIAPRPVLLQFGSKDPHVKNEAAMAQANAVKEPKTVKIYDGAEHELTFQARLDRIAWLKEQFKLTQ